MWLAMCIQFITNHRVCPTKHIFWISLSQCYLLSTQSNLLLTVIKVKFSRTAPIRIVTSWLGEGNIYSTLALDPLLVAWIFKRFWKFSACKRSSIMQSVKAFLLFLYRLSETICGPSLFWCKSRRKVLDVSVVVETFFHPIDNTRSFQQT